MALTSLKIYQDTYNPDNLQVVGFDDATEKQIVKSLTQAEYQQLKALGIPEQKVAHTTFQGTQLGSLEDLKSYAASPPKYPSRPGVLTGAYVDIEKWKNLFATADFAALPTTGFTAVAPAQPTAFQTQFAQQKAAGKTPTQISQDWATQQKTLHPERYLPPTPGAPLASLGAAPTLESISAGITALSKKATALQQKVATEGITSELLEPSQEIDLGDTTVPKDTGGATIASAEITQKSIDDYIKMLTGDTTAAQTKETDLIARMNELLGEAGGKTAMLAEEETKAGVDTITKQLKNIQNEIAIKTAAFKQLYADIEGKPITMASIIGETARARAVEQADIGFLQAQALALQNNLSFAQQTAQKAVDTKYGPIEEELKIKAAQLELIQGQLSAKEKIRAEALKLFLADQKTAITDAKATEKQRTDYLLQQMNKYPSAGLTLQDTYETAQAKILKSVEYRQEVEKGEPGIDTEVVDDFNKEMFDWDLEGTRESFIRRLQSRFPDIDPDDIARKVYETYPDDYKQETKGEKVITSGQVLEVAKEMKLDDVENYLRATYSDDELKKLAKDAGFGAWNKSAETEVKEYLESPSAREKLAELLVKRYKESGYTIED